MSQPLSPAAQIMIAVTHIYQEHGGDPPARAVVAAALIAASDQVAPSDAAEPRNNLPMALECQRIRAELFAIAAELGASVDRPTHPPAGAG